MSVSVYIHIPFCVSKCIYCDFFSVPVNCVKDEYISALCNEIIYRAENHKDKKIKTVYIGGGTPSLLKINQLIKIENTIKNNFDISELKEFTIEVNPDDVTESFLNNLKKTSVNRISCGIQSINEDCLCFSKRRGKVQDNLTAMKLLETCWGRDYSFDFICGLPGEDEQSFLHGLEIAVKHNPSHISMYSLTVEDETPLGKLFNNNDVEIDFEKSDLMWLKGRDFLEKNGYEQYEVSNFCKKGKESVHNLSYWDYESYLGIGSGATGTVYYGQNAVRWTNSVDIENYIDFWNCKERDYSKINLKLIPQNVEKLDKKTLEFEFFMMGFRKLSGISKSKYENIFNEKISEKNIEIFENWNRQKLLQIKTEKFYNGDSPQCKKDIVYSLTKEGILLLNRLLEQLE